MLTTTLVRRFANNPRAVDGGMRWDVAELFENILAGLAWIEASETPVLSIGVDSWAVDYGLLKNGTLTAAPRHYRDRTAVGSQAVHELVDRNALFDRNGIQFLPFNTVYQLADDKMHGSLGDVDSFLLIPDLIAYWMTGVAIAEETNASTTGLLPTTGLEWDGPLIETLGFAKSLFPRLVRPGHQIGALGGADGKAVPLVGTPVIAVGSHDTASAVVAVPMEPTSSVYISCGTWGLVGIEVDEPILTTEAQRANFTNERGVDGTTRFLQNVMGLWMLSECVRGWEKSGLSITLETLLVEASMVEAPPGLLDVNASVFAAPRNMSEEIVGDLRERGLPIPSSPAQMTRLILESLAAAFVASADQVASLAAIDVGRIHIVGGGALNQLLCQLIADRAQLEVIAGPVEATAMGNMLIQARAVGLLEGDLAALRDIVRSSCELTAYRPERSRS
ncbi:UNVERIFIED_CONTAM: hypothetical protein GTU68_041648 [Idotea baltica]|nr:hypothetical protein [Idotea baltica]